MGDKIKYPLAAQVTYYPIMGREFTQRVIKMKKANKIFLITEKKYPFKTEVDYELDGVAKMMRPWNYCDVRINRQDINVKSLCHIEWLKEHDFAINNMVTPYGAFTVKYINSFAKLENLERTEGIENIEPSKSSSSSYKYEHKYENLPDKTNYVKISLPQSLDHISFIELIVDGTFLFNIQSLFEVFLSLGREDIRYEDWIEDPYILIRNIKFLKSIQIIYSRDNGEVVEIPTAIRCYKKYNKPNKLTPIKKLIVDSELNYEELESLYNSIGSVLGKDEERNMRYRRVGFGSRRRY